MSNDNKENANSNSKAMEKREPTVAERFVAKVRSEFAGAVGHGAEFSEHEKQLASNLYMKIDSQLKAFEADRQKKNKSTPPVTWNNVNMQKLAQDAVHRVRLGLDALIDNHVHPIPYLNGKTGKYDLDLQIGYAGLDFYKRQVSVDPIKHIRYELIHENDEFSVIKQDMENEKDNYLFKIKDPLDRGRVKGGFGYIIYEDESKNEVITITEEEFKKTENAAPSSKFWGNWPLKMRYKTLVRRVTKEIRVDPEKVNPSYHYVEAQDSIFNDDKEVRVEQPTERQALDFNDASEISTPEDNAGNGARPEPKAKEQAEKPATEKEQDDTGGSEAVASDHEQLMADVNALGKDVHGSNWYRESKVYVANYDEEAENLLDLDEGGLKHIKRQLESKAEKQEA